MTRSRQSAKGAGTRFERQIADYLAEALQDDRVDRMPLFGNRDRGDISGVRVHGQKLAIECKDRARIDLPAWTAEARIAAGNADALAGIVISKRTGVSLEFSRCLVEVEKSGTGRLSGLIVANGYDGSAGVARWAGFPGPNGLSGRLDGGSGVHGKAARSRCQHSEIAVAHRQVESMRRRT
jgi:hypothetical protein